MLVLYESNDEVDHKSLLEPEGIDYNFSEFQRTEFHSNYYRLNAEHLAIILTWDFVVLGIDSSFNLVSITNKRILFIINLVLIYNVQMYPAIHYHKISTTEKIKIQSSSLRGQTRSHCSRSS